MMRCETVVLTATRTLHICSESPGIPLRLRVSVLEVDVKELVSSWVQYKKFGDKNEDALACSKWRTLMWMLGIGSDDSQQCEFVCPLSNHRFLFCCTQDVLQ